MNLSVILYKNWLYSYFNWYFPLIPSFRYIRSELWSSARTCTYANCIAMHNFSIRSLFAGSRHIENLIDISWPNKSQKVWEMEESKTPMKMSKSPGKRHTPSRSQVWQYISCDIDAKVARCNICNKTMKYTGGTTNLRYHLTAAHQMQEFEVGLR